MSLIALKRGEAKTVVFTLTENGAAIDLSGATFSFKVKRRLTDTSAAIIHADGDFDKTQAASGIVSVFLTTADTDREPGDYVGELQITFAGGPPTTIDKSATFTVRIEAAVH